MRHSPRAAADCTSCAFVIAQGCLSMQRCRAAVVLVRPATIYLPPRTCWCPRAVRRCALPTCPSLSPPVCTAAWRRARGWPGSTALTRAPASSTRITEATVRKRVGAEAVSAPPQRNASAQWGSLRVSTCACISGRAFVQPRRRRLPSEDRRPRGAADPRENRHRGGEGGAGS
jgi:hypothetical protein